MTRALRRHALAVLTAGISLALLTSCGPQPPRADRVAGEDRYGTAVELSKMQFPHGSDAVVLASGEKFADALSAAPLAHSLKAPVLLVAQQSAPTATVLEVLRLTPRTVYVVGGVASVSDGVLAGLADRGLKVERLAGSDRYGTSAIVALSVLDNTGASASGEIVLASGDAEADGLAGAAYAAAGEHPFLLVRRDGIPESVRSVMALADPMRITVVGGVASISDSVLAGVSAYSQDGARRVSGADRYGTFAALQGEAWSSAPAALVVTGATFPDGLGAAALGVPLLFRETRCVPEAAAELQASWGTKRLIVVGGSRAIQEDTDRVIC